ncbi:MAG: peptidoglycan-binding protein [Bacilli bacterium]
MGRNISELHPVLQTRLEQLKEICNQQGLNIGIGECFRTVAEQDALYAQGRTTQGKKVTNAKGSTYSSQHQWGIAFDFFENVKGHEFENISFFNQVGNIAKDIGLGWGGDWKNPVDKPHLYLSDWGNTTSQLKTQYGTIDTFRNTWNNNPTKEEISQDQNIGISINETIKNGQIHSNNFANCNIKADGIYGNQTKKAGIKVLQQGLNLDYNSNIAVDGIFGNGTRNSLGNHSVRYGEKQYMVTTLEILLMLKGYNPNGVECPGVFGRGLESTVRRYQSAHGLSADGIAGVNTFKSLIE